MRCSQEQSEFSLKSAIRHGRKSWTMMTCASDEVLSWVVSSYPDSLMFLSPTSPSSPLSYIYIFLAVLQEPIPFFFLVLCPAGIFVSSSLILASLVMVLSVALTLSPKCVLKPMPPRRQDNSALCDCVWFVSEDARK